MRKLAFLFVAFALVAVSFYGCDETKLTEPSVTNDESAADVAENTPSQAPLLSSQNGKAVLPFWATGGNANTNPSSHFLGTLDNKPLVLRTNGAEALRVTTDGRVGIGTANPQRILHVVNTDSPGGAEMMVEETRPGAAVQFDLKNTRRTWTLLSDADPDHLRIAGAGSGRSPFTILGGSGNVGMGTENPQSPLHVVNGTAQAELIVQETRAGQAAHFVLRSTRRSWWLLSQVNPDRFSITGSSGTTHPFVIRGSDGNVGMGAGDPNYPLEMASGAHVTVGGVWTDASSRAYKENIRDLTIAEAQAALNGLTPVQFNYKADRDEGYVGFIAEDVPEMVATQDRDGLSPMDIVAVLTKVVQQQEEKIAELEARLDALH